MTKRAPLYSGSIDVVDGISIQGWAADLNDYSREVAIEVLEAGTLVQRVPATAFRQDLVEAGIGKGRHGYEVTVPTPPGETRCLRIKIAGTGTYLRLGEQLDVEVIGVAAPEPQYLGSVDSIDKGVVRGWVADMTDLSRQLQVEVLEDGVVVDCAVASLFRADLEAAGFSQSAHGYELPVRVALNEKRVLRLKVRDTDYHLPFRGELDVVLDGNELFGPRYIGAVDAVEGGTIRGWAADLNDASKRLEIEFLEQGRTIHRMIADRFRADVEAGIGAGEHAFEYSLPVRPGTMRALRVKIAETERYLLKGDDSEIMVDGGPLVDYVACDIVNNCNLRCPFCIVDYSRVSRTHLMKEHTFRNLCGVLEVVGAEGFWLSCLHEPTLNPKLADFIEIVPVRHREKVWFTTNLCRRLPDREIERWVASGIHHVNISFDSRDPDLFAILRTNGRYEAFEDNLRRLVKAAQENGGKFRLRFITMAFQSNLAELPDLVRFCHEECGAFESEIRYTYNVAHIADDFRQTQYLTKEQWNQLDTALNALPYRIKFCRPPDEDYENMPQPSANFEPIRLRTGPVRARSVPLKLRAQHDGTVLLEGQESVWAMNVNDVEDPIGVLRRLVHDSIPSARSGDDV